MKEKVKAQDLGNEMKKKRKPFFKNTKEEKEFNRRQGAAMQIFWEKHRQAQSYAWKKARQTFVG